MAVHTIPYTDAEALAAAIAGGLNKIVWKDASEQALADLNRTTTLDWTDLDLTAYTSADAKFAILTLIIAVDSIEGVSGAYIGVRKNGTTPTWYQVVNVASRNGDIAGSSHYATAIVGLDSGQVIEYILSMYTTIQFDSYINVLGYIE